MKLIRGSDILPGAEPLINACKKTLCLIRKRQVRGLRSQKKRSLLFVNEHFSDKRNEEIGVFLQTQISNKKEGFIYWSPL